ncbi:Serine/arginine repetitive matrix-like protein [Heracleum sosnowskyi]|uniref:Serine/arginine repetitive matrix-like protein n=1 Tax=Heracleum sosnowskyi TaxID=360622 RepID=A0AAD8M7J8_9APIA|nr:Serine/arginine repetitive matrix-like protein [Heracleum sosnowskyi]
MASACINNISLSPEKFLDCPATFPSYGWLSPQMSFGRDEEASKPTVKPRPVDDDNQVEADEENSCDDIGDFEFRLDYPVTMLPADELFSDGKLMPLQFRPAEISLEVRLPDTPKVHRSCEISGMDPYLFSPKAPRCSSRWKELLGLKRLYQNNNAKLENPKTTTSATGAAKSLKHFLHRNSKAAATSTIDSSLSLPLLRDTDNESISISSRLSLSSSSSGHDHDDLPRLSLDLEKPHGNLAQKQHHQNPPRIRLVKHRSEARMSKSPMRRQVVDNNAIAATRGGVSLDSPRMNSSGKIVFQSLERSSSSPSSFNGGPRHKHRGVERSYSANVRVTPVLNVPVCSLRGSSKSGGVFGFPLFSAPPHKRDNGTNGSRNQQQQQSSSNKNKTDRSS